MAVEVMKARRGRVCVACDEDAVVTVRTEDDTTPGYVKTMWLCDRHRHVLHALLVQPPTVMEE